MQDVVEEILINEAELKARVKELGKQISQAYNQDDDLVLVCILRGGFVFMADLAREIKLPVIVDFMDVTSYDGTTSTGNVRIIKDLEESIEDKHVLIIEDIIDTGRTISKVINLLKTRDPLSVKVCTLLDKPDRRVKKEVESDWNGFEIPDKFVLGYGLDYEERYRNVPYIFVLKPELYQD